MVFMVIITKWALMMSTVNTPRPPARKERFVNNIDTSTRKVSKLNLNFRICKLYIPKIILLLLVSFQN